MTDYAVYVVECFHNLGEELKEKVFLDEEAYFSYYPVCLSATRAVDVKRLATYEKDYSDVKIKSARVYILNEVKNVD